MPDPDLDHFHRIARQTLDDLPEAFARGAADLVLQVVDWPDDRMLRELDIDDPLDLTGLYDGIPMTEKSVIPQPLSPDSVWLFREPILAEWHDRGDVEIEDLVAHVTIHEFAHHFGWSDDDIASIDKWWE